ncbi:MAG: hypothetical protein KJ941_09810 [Bacteroidetes bacterium]|nr:hypothetical protein [Bacteroidota bacterium]
MQRFFLTIVLLGLMGCQTSVKKDDEEKIKVRPPSLIHYQMLYSDMEREISFPLWFNDSLIEAHRIRSITRSIYPRQKGDSLIDTALAVPREQWTYLFKTNGRLERIYHRTFYDDRLISMFLFRYLKKTDGNNFSQVQMDSLVRFEQNKTKPVTLDRTEDMYRMYTQKMSNQEFSSFQNKESRDVLFLLHSRKKRNPLDIEKLLHPLPYDRIIIGDLPFPEKIYSVENRVKEKRVRSFSYVNKSIERVVVNDFPFRMVRSFSYDTLGYCTGYLDSLFGDDTFLTKTKTEFILNQFKAPNSVIHFKQNQESSSGFSFVENFQYELYP